MANALACIKIVVAGKVSATSSARRVGKGGPIA
jgi:hypothetical protein